MPVAGEAEAVAEDLEEASEGEDVVEGGAGAEGEVRVDRGQGEEEEEGEGGEEGGGEVVPEVGRGAGDWEEVGHGFGCWKLWWETGGAIARERRVVSLRICGVCCVVEEKAILFDEDEMCLYIPSFMGLNLVSLPQGNSQP